MTEFVGHFQTAGTRTAFRLGGGLLDRKDGSAGDTLALLWNVPLRATTMIVHQSGAALVRACALFRAVTKKCLVADRAGFRETAADAGCVMPSMICLRHQFEIFYAIVRRVPILVMDNLIRQKGSLKMRCHDKTMLINNPVFPCIRMINASYNEISAMGLLKAISASPVWIQIAAPRLSHRMISK